MAFLRERLPGAARRSLSRVPSRVEALSRFVTLTGPYLPPPTLDHANGVVARAGDRLALSGSHTVVALAGPTGSGKSSLFNALAAEPLSPAGLRRPTTGIAHAVAFSQSSDDAAALLDWLGVPVRYAADSPELEGLVLVDLPDIDSVERAHGLEADRLLDLVDLVVWVLDPQKYADLTVHRRYRETFRHHGDITVVALNQADRLSESDLRRCLDDLAGLLRADGLRSVPIVATSTIAAPGIAELRSIVERAVAARISFLQRLSADITAAAASLSPLMAADPPPLDPAGVPLVPTLAAAAGVPAVVAAARQSYVYRAARLTGWPVTRWLRRFRGDPLRRLGLAGPAAAGVGVTAIAPPSPEARARVSLATRALGQQAGSGLAPPWPSAFLQAARSRAGDLTDALDVAIARTDLSQTRTPAWWRLVGLMQWLLLGAAVAGVAWLAVRWVAFALALPMHPPPMVGRLPWPTLLLAGGLLGGLLLAALARLPVALGSRRHAARTARQLERAVASVADELVLAPVARVRDDYLAARSAIAIADADADRR